MERSGMPTKVNQLRDDLGHRITRPFESILLKSGLNPNVLTLLGFAINLVAAAAIALQHPIWGGLLVLFAGLFDLLDGSLARASKKVTTFGGLLDSVVDRLSEAAVLFGLLVFYVTKGNAELQILLVFLALVGSFVVSYVRARSEGLGLQGKVGVFTRGERVVVLALGLLLNQMFVALLILLVFSFTTIIQRMLFAWQQASKKNH